MIQLVCASTLQAYNSNNDISCWEKLDKSDFKNKETETEQSEIFIEVFSLFSDQGRGLFH